MADKLRICRAPGCLIAFDPMWRVRLAGEPADADNLCPRCGFPLDRNAFIRRITDEDETLRVSQEQ